MLETQVIMRISDFETTLEDYKYGLYSDAQLVTKIKTITSKLETAILSHQDSYVG